MRKVYTLTIGLLCSVNFAIGQTYFEETFDNYKNGDSLSVVSKNWQRWSGLPSEEAIVANNKSFSGSNALYIESTVGSGPQDIVLDLGNTYGSGRVKMDLMMFIPKSKAGYFNIQATTPGTTWAFDIYFRSGGTYDITNPTALNGNYPQDRWFKVTIDADLDNGKWEMLFNDTSEQTFNNTNSIAYVDIFPADANSEFWIDDIKLCTNKACNPEIELNSISISPTTICSGKKGDVTVKLTNNSLFEAQKMELGILVGSQTISHTLKLNDLPSKKDTTIVVKDLFVSNIPGNNVNVYGVNFSGDLVPSNDTTQTIINVGQAPSGNQISPASGFKGIAKTGVINNPDIGKVNQPLVYEIDPPKGYQNNGYGTTWEAVNASVTSDFTPLPSNLFSFTAPNGGNNAEFTFNIPSYLEDTTLILRYVISNKANGCDSTVERYLFVASTPHPNFTYNGLCEKAEITFTDQSTIKHGQIFYKWDFGDGKNSTDKDPKHTFDTTGTFDVKLTTTSDYNIVEDTTITITIHPKPYVNFSFVNQCENIPIPFTNQTQLTHGKLNYFWDFGNTKKDTVSNPSYTYATPGTYTVNLTAESDKGCFDDTSYEVSQYHTPIARFDAYGTCQNREISFISNSFNGSNTPLTESWIFGDGNNGVGDKPKHTYPNNGEYTVKMIAETGFGCKDSITKVVDVQQGPKADFTLSDFCSLSEVTLINLTDDGGTATTYSWELPNSTLIENEESPKYTFTKAGFVGIKLNAVSDNGCTNSRFKQVEIKGGVLANFEFEGLCEENQFEFTNKSTSLGNVDLSWEFGDNTTSKAANPFKNYSVESSTTFDVTLYASVNGECADTITQQVKVGATPECTFTAKQGADKRSFTFIPDNADYAAYEWTIDGQTLTDVSPEYTFTDYNREYTVKLATTTADDCHCDDGKLTVRTDWTDNIEQLSQFGVRIYPNPANNTVNIDWSKAHNLNIQSLKIISSNGAVLMTTQTQGNTQHQWNTSNLSPGLYWIEADVDGNRVHQKLIIVR